MELGEAHQNVGEPFVIKVFSILPYKIGNVNAAHSLHRAALYLLFYLSLYIVKIISYEYIKRRNSDNKTFL